MIKTPRSNHPIAVIGAGPAGLTAAYLLVAQGWSVEVVESHPTLVGGIARTESHHGFRFDIGGHRFFTKDAWVDAFWRKILPTGFNERSRKSRILYGRRLFSYPLVPLEALRKLGLIEAIRCVLSYFRSQLTKSKHDTNFEVWVVRRFGRRLFEIFFKTYTEKVWGMRCSDISADWAAQRIQNLSLARAALTALTPRFLRRNGQVVSLLDRFYYPDRGPGMMWEACAKALCALGGKIHMGEKAEKLTFDPAQGSWLLQTTTRKIQASHILCSAAIRDVIEMLSNQVSSSTLEDARELSYRDFITVALIVRNATPLEDQWIYVHDSSVKVGRIQNFGAWSSQMIPIPGQACFGLEYFCFENDALWASTDLELLELAKSELIQLGFAKAQDIVDGKVIRQAKAYPVYDEGYQERIGRIREECETRFPTLHMMGRNGLHRYNNQDHSMLTAKLAVENILAGSRVHDVWSINLSDEYIESSTKPGAASVSGLREIPVRASQHSVNGQSIT